MQLYKTLEEAAQKGQFSDCIYFVAVNRVPNQLFDDGYGGQMRPLHLAVAAESVEALNILFELGADPNLTDGQDRTPLHDAALKGNIEIVAELLKHSADPNQKEGKMGETPLHIALRNGHDAVAKLLIDGGADVNISNNLGIKPSEIAVYRYLVGHK